MSALCACAGAKSPSVSNVEGVSQARQGPRVVLAPLNLPVPVPAEVEDAVPIVERALIDAFQARGARVGVIHPSDAYQLWRAAASAIPPSGDPAADLRNAARKFAEAMETTERYDVLILPSLVLREARVSGRNATWDGVTRRIPVRTSASAEETHTAPDAPVFDTSEGLAASPQWGGKIAGLSLHMLSFRPGFKPRERFAGLDIVHETVQVRDPAGAGAKTELRPRADLFTDREELHEAIEAAVEPVWARVKPSS